MNCKVCLWTGQAAAETRPQPSAGIAAHRQIAAAIPTDERRRTLARVRTLLLNQREQSGSRQSLAPDRRCQQHIIARLTVSDHERNSPSRYPATASHDLTTPEARRYTRATRLRRPADG